MNTKNLDIALAPPDASCMQLLQTIRSYFKFPGIENLVLNKNKVVYSGLVFQYSLYLTLPWVQHNAQAFK
jgi:hypothetical protein